MTSPAIIKKTFIHDEQNGQKEVGIGDQVIIMPADIRIKTGQDEKFFAQESVDFLRNWIGEGPFTISKIGKWPCGKDMLYLDATGGNNCGQPGCYASDFMSVN